MGLSTGKSKVLKFDEDDGEVDVEEFEMRAGEDQANCKFVSTAAKKEDCRVEYQARRGAPTSFKLLETEVSATGPGKKRGPSNHSRYEEELRERDQISLSKGRPSEFEPYPCGNSPSPEGGRTSRERSVLPSHIDFYTERTQGRRPLGKCADLQDREFVEKCDSDTVALDEGRNSYLEHVRNYNRGRRSIESQEEGYDLRKRTDRGAVLVLDQSAGQLGGQVSFSMVTQGELQECLKNSRNTGPREAPSL